jgi:hypothetical protein
MTQKISGLEDLDGVLLDGLEFCSRVYAAFDRVVADPGGQQEINLRTTARSKRLVEELLPLTQYVQARYGLGYRMRIRWRGGSQRYDARILVSGRKVRHFKIPAVQHIELTSAVHSNDYLIREHLDAEGGGFGPHGTTRDRASGRTVSTPVALSHQERLSEQVTWVRNRIDTKARKPYPSNTTLLVVLAGSSVMLDDEWQEIVQAFKAEPTPRRFREVLLAHPVSERITSIMAGRRP